MVGMLHDLEAACCIAELWLPSAVFAANQVAWKVAPYA